VTTAATHVHSGSTCKCLVARVHWASSWWTRAKCVHLMSLLTINRELTTQPNSCDNWEHALFHQVFKILWHEVCKQPQLNPLEGGQLLQSCHVPTFVQIRRAALRST
jgi:hypothetical protein